MRQAAIAALLCMGAIAAAGCGNDRDDRVGSAGGPVGGTSARDQAPVQVPDVTGQSAEEGASALEARGFASRFEPEPENPGLCTVSDQDETGEIEEGTEVTLTLECKVDVPDLSDERAEDAVSKLDALGLTASYEEEPEDPSPCTVEDQDVTGEAEPESEVVLSVVCRLPDETGKDLQTAVSELERLGYKAQHRSVVDPTSCTVTSHRSEAEPGDTVDLTVHCPFGR